MNNCYKTFLKAILLIPTIFLLVGCSAGSLFPTRSKAEDHQAAAARYLKMAEGSPSAYEYRLRAADHYLKANQISEVARVLRRLQEDPNLDLVTRNQLLEARLALLQHDTQRSQTLLQKLLAPFAHKAQPSFQANSIGARKIALLLPSKGPHAEAAKTIQQGFLAAYYKSARQDASAPTVKLYDTGEGKEVVAAYQKALQEGADFIVGPLTKPEVQALSSLKLQTPVLALNTLPSLQTGNPLYQFGLMPEDELMAIVEKAFQEGHRHSIALAPQTEWGRRMTKTFVSLWQNRGGQVVVRSLNKWEPLENQLEGVLKQAKDSDMVFLAVPPELARQIKPLLSRYQPTLAVYASASVYSGHPAPQADQTLEGIRFCDIPWVIQHPAESATAAANPRYFALGMDAYSLATQLSRTYGLPASGLPGLTGMLQLDGQRIHRRLMGAKFEQGLPVPD